ncbi:MAG: DUF4287 domain-containing protein [Candidatus Saccharimonadia bacterium]
MSFQAYIDTIKAKTGKTPEYFLEQARQKGFLEDKAKTSDIINWLKKDYDLGRGHAMALVVSFNSATKPKQSIEEGTAQHFGGTKTKCRQPLDELVKQVHGFGPEVSVWPGRSYLSLQREGKKFAIIQITANRFDIGIKRKGVSEDNRFEAAGVWNSMVTHRVRITEPAQIDAEVLDWLKQAYLAA